MPSAIGMPKSVMKDHAADRAPEQAEPERADLPAEVRLEVGAARLARFT